MTNYNHALSVLDKLDFPAEAKETIVRAEEKILNNPLANKIYESVYKDYWVKKKNFPLFAPKVKILAKIIKEQVYTVNFVLLLNCTEPLLKEYKKANIGEEIYWNTLFDLKAKLLECKEVHNVWGTFVEDWFLKFYKLERFALGRFQYEFSKFTQSAYNKHGVTLKKGDFVVTMHIPSHLGPITYDIRMDSYKKAYDFFRDKFNDGYAVFTCDSWLLYPDNLKILPKSSNVCDFIRDFEILEHRAKSEFKDGWRIYGAEAKKPVSELPRETSMQRAFAQWLEQGNRVGDAYGIIVFDGEKILTGEDAEEAVSVN